MTMPLFHHTLPSSMDVVQDNSPLPIFAPTTAHLVMRHTHIPWNARKHRKQRYQADSPRTGRRRFHESPWVRIARMSQLEYWNISWWVAVVSGSSQPTVVSHDRYLAAFHPRFCSLGYQWIYRLPALCHLPCCIACRQWMVSVGRGDHLRLWICAFDPGSVEQRRRGMLWLRRRPSSAVPSPQA